jgi:two-component system chemotaxis response regulator CheY
MINLNSDLETGIGSAGVVIMLCMAVWLLFRHETNGEKSLFLKMIDSFFDDEIEQRSSVPPFLPSFNGGSSKDLPSTHARGGEALNQSMRLMPFGQPKKGAMEPQCASYFELRDGKNTGQPEPLRPPSEQPWQRTAGMFSGQTSLGGILVVDDDPDIREFIRIILENIGYDVLEAKNGAQAINVLGSGETPMVIDAIITDLSTPNINGVEPIAFFQKEFPSIPLIVLTGIDDLELAFSFTWRGVSDYLVKPLDRERLKASLAHVIAEPQLS